jgi:hypothetical protein
MAAHGHGGSTAAARHGSHERAFERALQRAGKPTVSTSPAVNPHESAGRAKLQVVGGQGPTGSRWLRRMLLVLDLASVAIAWGVVLALP